MSTTAEQITELQSKISATEREAHTSTEADRARLEELRKKQAAETEAEHARRTERREAWARHYLAHEHGTATAEAAKAVTAARREFETVLAEQPWVKALLAWQAALNEQRGTIRRAAHARALLGQPGGNQDPSPRNVLPMLDNQVGFDPIGRVLHFLAAGVAEVDPAAEVDTLAAHPDDDGDPLAEAVSAERVSKSDPLAYLARNGARLDVDRHTADDGTPVLMHRNPVTAEWVTTDTAGNITGTSWTTDAAKGKSSNLIDGREFGSEYDAEQGKFVKVRIR